MNRKPLVSIITPSYNQGQFLGETIQSVLNQDYEHIEYIIIDGGSSDNSLEIIHKYSDRLAYYVSEPDNGQTEAINKGFAKANGEIFAWLNSDDTLEPSAVSEAVNFLQNNPDIGMVYGDTNFIDLHGNKTGRFPAAQTDYNKLRQGYVHIPQQSSFWRAELFKQVGPLDEKIYFAMDYDLWVRLAKVSELKYHPRTWANFRLHSGAKTIAEDDRCWPEMVAIHKRDGGRSFSIIVAKYYLRKALAPLVTWRRRRRVQQAMEQKK
jgi:glycosyltransferase involved in cell wall biosynthesis